MNKKNYVHTRNFTQETRDACEDLKLPLTVLAAWQEYNCANNEDATPIDAGQAHEAFEGIWPSEKAFAQHLVAETSPHPQPWFVEYLDWQGLADALFSGDYAQIELPSGEIAVFRA